MNGTIQCPVHHCWLCEEGGTGQNRCIGSASRRTCWYCPRSYHRYCVPMSAELMSVQVVDTNETITKYPNFRYDLITCCWNDADKDPSKLNHSIHCHKIYNSVVMMLKLVYLNGNYGMVQWLSFIDWKMIHSPSIYH